jgi:hypothetical protein
VASFHFAGATASPEELWMKQMARNLTAADEGFLVGKRYLLMDRDTKFSVIYSPELLSDRLCLRASIRGICRRLPLHNPIRDMRDLDSEWDEIGSRFDPDKTCQNLPIGVGFH